MKEKWRFIVGIAIGVVVAYYMGAMWNFAPFLGDDLGIRAIGFCTLIVCVVMAICTCIIVDKIEDRKK